MSITKKDIADLLVEQIGITHNQALSMTNNFFDTIKGSLAKGEDVKLSGFGNFIIREKVARPGRNPKTGEPVTISARKVATFKAGLKLKKITKLGV
ncbi:Integration host factor alpha subunit [Bathymodiolus thermophilus thioautotrophic gill symbiont]|jgi:integration host factor subunit alpha|uniref:Integration host factor subunit alpha n=3 Tax=sulfur-oxidizing symbionts TaxID=32036 RepID=A0A1H6JPU2_9GAMM|nr:MULTISPECIES: integration host factor subunit alpha [Gammaproteobacteria]CAC9483815.1 Integration host factor alpha subunit [uncultured Gammaproteobacteria bacterium]CAB5498843.1 Integration host factor alpha subunit [Bathymodiolus azoricus thioautotrophic gill symbiont]CAB5504292.1 Integration host factor alpha subunit [Bathymodiolus thermophilus thioautotrophic gill symbiont]CAC9502536.1 Integration host factor alpha subunit [uncultured Gammaproteobacteria bacterium]CAC9505391.1 Integrati